MLSELNCTPGRSRTCDLQSRSLTLYPSELRALNSLFILSRRQINVKHILRVRNLLTDHIFLAIHRVF